MSLFQDWKELMENQTEDTFEGFWKEYPKQRQRFIRIF